MRIGLFSDLHLGHSGTGRWHNRLLFDCAERVARETVALLNRQALDLVIVLGDITNHGSPEQLRLAKEVLDGLLVPWLVLPGNHDRNAVKSGRFEEVFGNRVPGIHRRLGSCSALFLQEQLPPDDRKARTELGSAIVRGAEGVVESDRPGALLVFSHFPLVPEEEFADQREANYAKHYRDGLELLGRLRGLVSGTTVAFCSHEHWHHVTSDDGFTQCTTASMIEYPMEARIVCLDGRRLSISTLDTACPEIAARSLESARWGRGDTSDRCARVDLGVRSWASTAAGGPGVVPNCGETP